MNKEQIEKYLQVNPFEQLSNIVYNLIVEDIAYCNIMPGKKINISQIAQDLNISRTPVREALMKLSQLGFVQMHNKSYYVSEFTPNDIVNIYYVRSMLESKATFLCAQSKKFPYIDTLKKLADDFSEVTEDYEKITDLDFKFHTILISQCGNEHLIDCYRLLENKFITLQRRNLKLMLKENIIPKIGSISTQHNSIVNSIYLNMPELAEKEMQNHINSGLVHALLFANK